MLNFITEYFWFFFILGMLSGIFLPLTFLISPYIIYLLMFVLFLSCLKIDIVELSKRIKDVKLVAYLTFSVLIISPILFYSIFSYFLEFEYSLAMLLLLVMPVGIAIPAYTAVFRGDKELSLILSIITSLLCPITIPFLIYVLAGLRASIDYFQVFTMLSIVIFIPFILSSFIKRISGKIVNRTQKYYSAVSIIVMSFVIAGAISKTDFLQTISNDKLILYPFILLFLLVGLRHIFGYCLVYRSNNKIRIASSLSISHTNSTLAIVVAAEFFSAKTLFLVTLYQIPIAVALIVFGYIARKYMVDR
ncbi:MAG: bile acid:sodium symporter [bacterium]